MSDYVWYPGIPPANPTTAEQRGSLTMGWNNAPPDLTAALAPVILISPGYAQPVAYSSRLAMILASQGFVVVGLNHPQERSPLSFVNRPMDVLFTLDQLAATNQTDFGGLMDTDHVGVMGDSYGAYTALAITGARIDPVAASALTAEPYKYTGVNDSDPRAIWSDWNWETVNAYRATFSSIQSRESWPAVTDRRILASVMLSVCWASMFGEQGLATVTVPSLIVGGTLDPLCPYQSDDVYAFEHLGSQNKYLLTVVGGGHVPLDDAYWPTIAQIYTAFFDDYLRGQEDDAQYLTATYVEGVEAQLNVGLVWGPYAGQ